MVQLHRYVADQPFLDLDREDSFVSIALDKITIQQIIDPRLLLQQRTKTALVSQRALVEIS